MFGLFKKDPVKKLEQEYEALLKKGMDLQRGGDIKGYAEVIAKSEEVARKIETLRTS